MNGAMPPRYAAGIKNCGEKEKLNRTNIRKGHRMNYCVYCGSEMYDDAVVCIRCGRRAEPERPFTAQSNDSDAMSTVIKVFLILGCISQGWMLIPLAWCIPMTVSIFRSLRDNRPISTGMKICTLLFVSVVSGICLLCADDK